MLPRYHAWIVSLMLLLAGCGESERTRAKTDPPESFEGYVQVELTKEERLALVNTVR